MTTIRVGQAVRYIAKEPPKGHDRPRRGDIGHVSQMNAEKTRAQIGDPVLVPHGGGRGGRDQLRTGHVIGCCVKGSEQCAIVSIGSSFRAFPIAGLIKVPEQRLLMSQSIRSKLEAFADGLAPEQRKHMLAIMRGMA